MAKIPPVVERSMKLETRNWKKETGNRKLENGNWGSQLPVSNFQFLLYGTDPETGNWKSEIRKQKSEIRIHGCQFPNSSFHFPLSGFSVQAAPAWLDFVTGPPDT
jgi:hypothetical protein